MRQTLSRSQRAGSATSLCHFRAALFLSVCLAKLALCPTIGDSQALSLTNPRDLLGIDPAAFAKRLQTDWPAPVSADERTRILRSLPPSGEVTDLDLVQLTKLSSLKRVFQMAHREAVYVVKVVDVPQAAIGLHARAVVLISEVALSLLSSDELQALAAHELGHEYVWDDYARAVQVQNRNRLKDLELMCDAIAIVTVHRFGMDSSPVISGIEKISRFNRERFGTAVNERNYPTLAERRAYARRIQTWLRQVHLGQRGGIQSDGSAVALRATADTSPR